MTQHVVIPDVQLRSWRATGYPYKLIAAAIAACFLMTCHRTVMLPV